MRTLQGHGFERDVIVQWLREALCPLARVQLDIAKADVAERGKVEGSTSNVHDGNCGGGTDDNVAVCGSGGNGGEGGGSGGGDCGGSAGSSGGERQAG